MRSILTKYYGITNFYCDWWLILPYMWKIGEEGGSMRGVEEILYSSFGILKGKRESVNFL
jgi:hypothetical protein